LLADALLLMVLLWLVSVIVALIVPRALLARAGIVLGCAVGIVACLIGMPGESSTFSLGVHLGDTPVQFKLTAGALWLMLFGLVPALFAAGLGTNVKSLRSWKCWLVGLGLTLLGAVGVFGLQDAMSFLIAWEVMSVGGAVMILGESDGERPGVPVLFMLGLLEVGAVAILLAVLLLANQTGFCSFASFHATNALSGPLAFLLGLLLLFGFGAKLGVLPFYEWFPAAYGSGSGATGGVFSGIVLNAAFYALARGVIEWLPHSGMWMMSAAGIMIFAGVLSAILAIFNAFQEEDWRRMLSLANAATSPATANASEAMPRPCIHCDHHSVAWGSVAFATDHTEPIFERNSRANPLSK